MKNYALKWVLQRVTALLLIPLTFWFIYSAISLSKMEYIEITIFFIAAYPLQSPEWKTICFLYKCMIV